MRITPEYQESVRQKYNDIKEIWNDRDEWHHWSYGQIEAEMRLVEDEVSRNGPTPCVVVDVGSAGHAYFATAGDRIDIDLAEKLLKGRAKPICCSAEALPLKNDVADLVVCVGPVLNYCSLDESISELARISKTGARLALHIELSNSFEFVGTGSWRSPAAFVSSFYKGSESYWVYSDALARRLLKLYGYRIERVRYFHFASSLIYRLTGNANLSSRFDALFSRLPGCGNFADSGI